MTEEHKQSRFLDYLPAIFHTDPQADSSQPERPSYMEQFLLPFEEVLTSFEDLLSVVDRYFAPALTDPDFLPWLANWFELALDPTWSEAQRRTLLAEAHQIYARRGTRWALSRVLEIYTGRAPEVVDLGPDQKPYTFTVRLPLGRRDVNRQLVQTLIDAHKPAHTTYTLIFES